MVYAYAKLTVTNPDALAQYRDKAGPALAKHGGAVVQAGGSAIVLDGTPDLPDVAAILSFPDNNSALAWINDPELTEVHNLRRGAGGSDIVLLG